MVCAVGLLVKKDFSFHLLDVADLQHHTSLNSSRLPQRQHLHFNGSCVVLGRRLKRAFSAVEEVPEEVLEEVKQEVKHEVKHEDQNIQMKQEEREPPSKRIKTQRWTSWKVT